MKYNVQFTMDDVGYVKVYIAKSKEQAIVLCTEEINKQYPLSVLNITGVVEEEKKGVKT